VLLPRQYSVQIHNVPKFDEQIYVKTTAVKQVSCRKIVIAQWTSSRQLYQFSIALETMPWFYSFEGEKMSIQIFFLLKFKIIRSSAQKQQHMRHLIFGFKPSMRQVRMTILDVIRNSICLKMVVRLNIATSRRLSYWKYTSTFLASSHSWSEKLCPNK